MIVILGPTACGKSQIAAEVSYRLNGEIISADSRQVYKGMDIGTGKDLAEYFIHGQKIPYHLIDIAEAGEEYNLFRFKSDFEIACSDILSRNKLPVLCGGTGLYLDAALQRYHLEEVPENPGLRTELELKNQEELMDILADITKIHNVTDTQNRERTIRAIEIALYDRSGDDKAKDMAEMRAIVFGILFKREEVRKRITQRLKNRLEEGMLAEVERLISEGVDPEKLKFYGLEYRYLTQYVLGEINYNDMFQRLNSAIHQFSKRQMTWFRKMEREGVKIHWLDGEQPFEEKVNQIIIEYKNWQNTLI